MTDQTSTWFITGAGRGLGRAITEAALDAGHRVVATTRSAHDLPEHPRLTVLTLDVRDRAACREAIAAALALTGRLDVLVNNAGYGLIGAIEEASESDVRELIDTDLLGALWLTQAAVEAMREQRSGHVVQISTVGAVGTMPTLGVYNAAKWALEGFSEALAGEVAEFGIRVTIVEPGGLDTAWATSSMRFAEPNAAYDGLRERLFGSVEVPWPVEGEATGGGTPTADAADAILEHVADSADERLRLLIGDDAPGQVAAALGLRLDDYRRDPRFVAASQE
ncbi:SDR family NAD(P)-dependent oxidoreductase [Schumannella sp. 10F1B-5-1]|uniref:SDR family NAD(P)-dependent oxidoreductase n=1 Tax=Schumannella sp. 10F1B-5-1 TaxID=2590780 RepID=UPI001130604D|nr:SDR family NAD(P)-dependent oxidoreductase [Schumannella sp. 10F1B-5-1]TPW72889.1 SDR family NAD(P)-dependent oxidoreductase [Schumannella sp. 10F1B-5-1]